MTDASGKGDDVTRPAESSREIIDLGARDDRVALGGDERGRHRDARGVDAVKISGKRQRQKALGAGDRSKVVPAIPQVLVDLEACVVVRERERTGGKPLRELDGR